jgi:hypothetical protein
MSTPAMALTLSMKWMLMGFWLVWGTTLLVSRIFIFHQAYTTHTAKVRDEEWLANQCSTPEFYSNIRQHTDLCEDVYSNSRASPFLVGLNAMAVNTYVCGIHPCTEVLQGILVKMGWQTVGVVAILFIFAPNLLALIYRTICGRSLTAHEREIFKQMDRHGAYCQDLQTSAPYLETTLRKRCPEAGAIKIV